MQCNESVFFVYKLNGFLSLLFSMEMTLSFFFIYHKKNDVDFVRKKNVDEFNDVMKIDSQFFPYSSSVVAVVVVV